MSTDAQWPFGKEPPMAGTPSPSVDRWFADREPQNERERKVWQSGWQQGYAAGKAKSQAAQRHSTPTSFTPGPWFVADWDADFGENLTTIEARQPEVLHPGQSSIWPDGIECSKVASTEDGSFDRETNLANARLIAASPWLLAECKAAKRALECIFDSGVEWYDNKQGDQVSVEGLIGSMEAAIAKAEQ